MAKHGDIGNGDTCPLFPEHGNMFVTDSKPPRQYCPHVIHDGRADKVPASRKFWPLHGFEESVTAYFARLDKAIREAPSNELPEITLEAYRG